MIFAGRLAERGDGVALIDELAAHGDGIGQATGGGKCGHVPWMEQACRALNAS